MTTIPWREIPKSMLKKRLEWEALDDKIKALGGVGSLTRDDIKGFTGAKLELLLALLGGEELSVPRMREITGQDQADRRMRDLRRDLEPKGFTIAKRKVDNRTFTYRLARVPQPVQGGLFDGQEKS